MSFAKNLKPLTKTPPKPVITWDKHERIVRNKEIWANKDSIVHRLPKHYQENYWKDILMDAKPVHYRPPLYRFHWDDKRKVEIETEVCCLWKYWKFAFEFAALKSFILCSKLHGG